jgi:hypothetical protein
LQTDHSVEIAQVALKKITENISNRNWLVVSTILKNISQWEGLSHILWKIKLNKECLKPPSRKSYP